MNDPAHLAIRRRICGWNEGENPDLPDAFFDSSVKRWIVASWAGAMDVFHSRNPGRPYHKLLGHSGRDSDQRMSASHQCPMGRVMGQTTGRAMGQAMRPAANIDELLAQGEHLLFLGMVFQKSPDSERLRKTIMRHLGNKQMLAIASPLDQLADRLVATSGQRGQLDVISELAEPLVHESLFGMLGIAPEKRLRVQHQLSRPAFLLFEIGLTAAERSAGLFAFAEIAKIAQEVLLNPSAATTPMASHWAEAVRRGVWSLDEATAQIAMLLLAGTITPVIAITSMIYQLAQHPAVWAAARAGQLPLDHIIDESLRLGPPKAIVPKSLSSDIKIGQAEIAAGQPILILVGRANRDSAEFSDPLAFNPWRPELRTLAFGDGSRRCPGVHLARMQMRVALSALLRHVPNLELVEAPSWTESLHCERVLERLRIRIGA